MFKSIALCAFLISSSAFANHLEKVCEQASVRSPVWDKNLVAYYDSGETNISTHNGTIITSTTAEVRGILEDGLSIWALTATNLVELDIAGEVVSTYSFENAGNPMWEALSMVKVDRKMIISRGAAGLLAYDLDKREVAWTNYMAGNNEGFPSGLAFDGQNIYAAVATSQERGFTGIIVVNPENGVITKRTAYDTNRWGVMDVDAKMSIIGDSLVVNNGGWLHLITKKQVESGKAIRPRWVAHRISQNGEVMAHYMMLKGEFILHDDQIMGCGMFTDSEEGRIVRKSKLFHVKLP